MKTLPFIYSLITLATFQLHAQKKQLTDSKQANRISLNNHNLIAENSTTTTLTLKNRTLNNYSTLKKTSLGVLKSNIKYLETLSIFPNPAKDYLNVKTKPNSIIKIYNQQDILVKSFDNFLGESFIDIRDLQKGMYKIDITEPGTDSVSYQLQVN